MSDIIAAPPVAMAAKVFIPANVFSVLVRAIEAPQWGQASST